MLRSNSKSLWNHVESWELCTKVGKGWPYDCKGGNVTSAGWQVTLCDPMWHVSSRSSVATLRSANCYTFVN